LRGFRSIVQRGPGLGELRGLGFGVQVGFFGIVGSYAFGVQVGFGLRADTATIQISKAFHSESSARGGEFLIRIATRTPNFPGMETPLHATQPDDAFKNPYWLG